MWFGGVRVVIPDEEGRILMVRQHHEDKDIWMVPGGGIEEGENAGEAAERELFEETGLIIHVVDLLWHVEEVSPERGQRFVNFFLAKAIGGRLELGADPEFGADQQVLKETRFVSREEIQGFENVYPEALREEIWEILDHEKPATPIYRLRK